MPKGLYQTVKFALKDIPWGALSVLGGDIVYTCKILIHLRVMCGRVSSQNRHSPNGLLHEEQKHAPQPGVLYGSGLRPQGTESLRGAGQVKVMNVSDAKRFHSCPLMCHM